MDNVKLLSETNLGPFFRHYDAIAVGFSKSFLSQWEQLNSSQTVSLMCSLVTNQLNKVYSCNHNFLVCTLQLCVSY